MFGTLERKLFISILLLSGVCTAYSCSDDNSPSVPVITNISPATGPPGATVTISGSGFSATASDNKVTFNGTLAQLSSASAQSLEATVPDAATSGAVSVVINGQTAVGPNFTVEEAMPGVSALEPDSGKAGTQVTISGMNFSPTPSENIVTFNGGVIAPVEQAASDELVTGVPEGALSGPIQVEVDGEKTLSPHFEVIKNGSLQIVSVTSGEDLDADGYTLTLENGELRTLGLNDTVTVNNVESGSYEIGLGGFRLNCISAASSTRTVSVQDGETTTEVFDISCVRIGTLLFEGDAGTNAIWEMNGDGSGQRNLTGTAERHDDHRPGPDGSTFASVAGIGADSEIYVDGEGEITTNSDVDDQPDLSPNGSDIAYRSYRSGDSEIWKQVYSSFATSNLTNNPASDTEPVWSPDGSQIAFISDRSGANEIWVMDADGSNPTQLTSQGADNPRWSPDGSQIMFTDGNIWTMNADGSNKQQLTNDGNISFYPPRWSPDGSRIVYRGGPLGNRDIYVIDSDGTNIINLTNDTSVEGAPSWSPDGSRITFPDNGDIWVIWADGRRLTNLSNAPNRTDSRPLWQPFE